MTVIITENIFNPWIELSQFEASQKKNQQLEANIGAVATFVGTMRDFNVGDSIESMTLEHYPKMVDKVLGDIVNEANKRWALLDHFIIHRVGKILPMEPIVLVAMWSSHRKDAFEACRFVMEELKTSAPFWKNEQLLGGKQRWVESNTKGY